MGRFWLKNMVVARALLIASSIHRPGGAGYVEAWILRGLVELNLEVTVVSHDFPHNHFTHIVKPILSDIKFLRLRGCEKRWSSPLINISNTRAIIHLVRRSKPDILWLMSSTPRSIVLKARESGSKIIVYYHMIAPWYHEIRGYYRTYSWRDLSLLWFALHRGLSIYTTFDLNPCKVVDGIVVNSKYMHVLAYRYWRIKPFVLPPPIELEKARPLSKLHGERSGKVLCFGRISPEKRYEDTIRAVAMTETKPGVVIAGALEVSRRSLDYVRKLTELAKKFGVDLRVIPNVGEKEKARIFSESACYIHNALAEHFGISIVEAMAFGLPVIVHRSGEPYYGIVDQGRYGLTYSSIEELAQNIDLLISSESEWRRFHWLSLQRAKDYSYGTFKERLSRFIRDAINNSP